MKVGDLVQTVADWSYKTWTGIVLEIDEYSTGSQCAKVLWTEASQVDGQIFFAPVEKLEVLSG